MFSPTIEHIAKGRRLLQQGDVSNVQHIEAAVGEHESLATGAQLSAELFDVLSRLDLLVRSRASFHHETLYFVEADGRCAELANRDPGCGVGESTRGSEVDIARKRNRQGCDHCVARACHVEDLSGDRWDEFAVALLEREHAFVAERDQDMVEGIPLPEERTHAPRAHLRRSGSIPAIVAASFLFGVTAKAPSYLPQSLPFGSQRTGTPTSRARSRIARQTRGVSTPLP